MAQIDKIKVRDTGYNIAASPNSTNEFTSNDSADSSAKGWTSVNTLSSGETNKSIFNKISSMFKNIRYLYNCLGRGIFNDTNTVAKALDTKASKYHSHDIEDIPHSTVQTNSTMYVPTSSLVYSMNEILKKINNAYTNAKFEFNVNNTYTPIINSKMVTDPSHPTPLFRFRSSDNQIVNVGFQDWNSYHNGVGLILESTGDPLYIDIKGSIYQNGDYILPFSKCTSGDVSKFGVGADYGHFLSFRGTNITNPSIGGLPDDYFVCVDSYGRISAGTRLNGDVGITWKNTIPSGRTYYGSSFPSGAFNGQVFFKFK